MAQTGIDINARPGRDVWLDRGRAVHHLLPLALIAVVTSGYAWRLVNPPTLWLDEAMLFVNVRDIAWRDILLPLPFYDQAAPLAYVALLKLIHATAGLQEALLRLPSWLALIATFALIARLPDIDRATRIITAALLAGSFVIARTVTDAKPYLFETLFAFALIIAFHPSARGIWRSSLFRLALLSAAMLMTTAFPLVAFAIGAPAILTAARNDVSENRPVATWQSARLAAIFAAALGLYAAYFVGYLSPGLKLIAANHAYGYGPSGFAPESAFYPQWIVQRLADIVRSHWQNFAPLIAMAGLAGGYLLARSGSIYAWQAAAMLGLIAIVNLSGHFPVMEERFSVFLMPWIALLAATGGATVLRLLPSPLGPSIGLAGLTAVALLPALDNLHDPFHQQARASLHRIDAMHNIPLVTTMAGQPIIDAYRNRKSDRSDCRVKAANATTTRCTAARNAKDSVFEGAATKWYLMNYIAVASWGGSKYGFPGRSLDAFADAYYDWVIANLRAHDQAHLLIVQGNTHMLTALRKRLQKSETLNRIIDERPASPTLAHSAAQLYLFSRSTRQPHPQS